jgi:hypothetical protein
VEGTPKKMGGILVPGKETFFLANKKKEIFEKILGQLIGWTEKLNKQTSEGKSRAAFWKALSLVHC